jgi:hypothetical protein
LRILFAYLDRADTEGLQHSFLTLAIRLQFAFAAKRFEILDLQWGTSVDVDRHISRHSDGEVRIPLKATASAIMAPSKQRTALKAWGTQLAAKRGHKRAVVAVARKLALVMHRIWIAAPTFRVSATDRDGERRIGTSAAVAHAA